MKAKFTAPAAPRVRPLGAEEKKVLAHLSLLKAAKAVETAVLQEPMHLRPAFRQTESSLLW